MAKNNGIGLVGLALIGGAAYLMFHASQGTAAVTGGGYGGGGQGGGGNWQGGQGGGGGGQQGGQGSGLVPLNPPAGFIGSSAFSQSAGG